MVCWVKRIASCLQKSRLGRMTRLMQADFWRAAHLNSGQQWLREKNTLRQALSCNSILYIKSLLSVGNPTSASYVGQYKTTQALALAEGLAFYWQGKLRRRGTATTWDNSLPYNNVSVCNDFFMLGKRMGQRLCVVHHSSLGPAPPPPPTFPLGGTEGLTPGDQGDAHGIS